MAQDVLITPASGKIEFLDSSDNVDGSISLHADGSLEIRSPGGDISIGDTTADVYIGDGTNNVDIIFEQDGEIRALTNKTLTIGSDSSNVDIKGASVTFTGADSAVFSGNVTASSFIGDGSSLTGISAGAQDGIFLEYNKIVSSNYTVNNGVTALTACNDSDGISIASGVTVTISDSSGWVITGGDKNMGLDAMVATSNQTERTMRTGTIKPTLDETYDIGDSAVVYDVGHFRRVGLKPITTTVRDALSGIGNGDLVYNSTTNKFQGYANGSWVDLH